MHQALGRSLRGAGLLAIVSALLVGCVRTQVRSITGPSGQAALFITCADAGLCYELAGRHCPRGYDLRPSKVDEHSVVVTCQAPAPAYAERPAPASPAGSYASGTGMSYDYAPAPMVDDPWQPGYAPPPAPPSPPRDQSSGMASPRPIGAGGPDLGY